MHPDYGRMNIIPGITFVVDTITGRSARVEKLLNNGVQVTVKQRGYELENWPWSWLTLRQPRLIKRYPRPFRFPREEKSHHCHCKIGKMEITNEKEVTSQEPFEFVIKQVVTCTRCKLPIGTESFPRRIERAKELVRKTGSSKPLSQVRQGVSRRKRKVPRSRKVSVKARRKGSSKLVLRPTRRSNAKTKAGTAGKRSKPLSKNRKSARPIPKRKGRTHPVPKRGNPKVPKTRLKAKGKESVKANPPNVRHRSRAKKVQTTDKVDIVASVPQSNPQTDVRGPGIGGTPDSSEVLPGVPGGADKIH